ncbi:hypothetical protein ACFSKI_18970 [Pseudogracilibacillus auburnensis]|uniref:Uncharacterized protein n=1 Tax=Pseudogracilibacillus auburnensis TaxID=1494959 RepID=A0A2V3W6K8_9BACI|nr:hypothetical protein [Pseudogracilibacillus auburnensis]PXW88778.1 hypothetical protein DFR56_103284 [Pseudogracilibacillus auburnensis]
MSIIENFNEFNYSMNFKTKLELLNMQNVIEVFLNTKHEKDLINIEIYDYSLADTVYNESNIDSFDFTSLSTNIDEDSEEFRLKVTIKKNNFSIYSAEKFLEHIDELEFKHILNNFNTFTKTPPESLYIAEAKNQFHSTLFSDAKSKINREKYISQMGDAVNAFGFPSHSLLPNDFDLNYKDLSGENYDTIRIFKFLKQLQGLLSLFYLSDFIELEKNKITLKINNTYTLRSHFDFGELSFSSFKVIDELYKVYRWVYENENNENIQDKLELARIQLAKNISFEDNCFHIETENIMSNLQSMYKIYLKENVDKYIEATNKVAEIISDMTFRQNEITSSFTNSLKTNSTLLIGFFISLVVYNNLAAGETSIFNESNFLLVILFTIISGVSLALSHRQVNRNLDRSIGYYNKQKEIYQHLFSKDDIKKLFSIDYIDTLEKNVKTDRNLYTTVWILELITIFSASYIATYYPSFFMSVIKLISKLFS